MQLVKLFQEQNWTELLTRCQEQITARPEWFTPYVMAGIAEANLGDKPRAIEFLEKAQAGMANSPDYEDLPQKVAESLQQLRSNP